MATLAAIASSILLGIVARGQRPKATSSTEMKDTLTALFVGEPTLARALYDLKKSAPLHSSSNWAPSAEYAKLKYRHGVESMVSFLLKAKRVDPKSGETMDCHVCGVWVSAVDYALQEGKWNKVGQTLDFAELGNWGDADPGDWKATPKEIAKGVAAFMFDSGSSGQGYTYSGKIIFAREKGVWRSLGFVETASDNSGECEDVPDPKYPDYPLKACWENNGTIEVLASSTRSYQDLAVRMKGTTEGKGKAVVRVKDVFYKYGNNGEYQSQLKR